MGFGLVALLDDVAALAKVAAASLDDVAAQATKAGTKAAGVVIDDAAVTPNYVVGFAADRELPIVRRIAVGSLKNKLLFLLPAALVLGSLAPGLILPILTVGGLYLCYEGAEKVLELVFPHQAHHHEAAVGAETNDPVVLENTKVAGAIKTDFILSGEIMAITLSSVATSSLVAQAAVLSSVGVVITGAVYGAVALIVKADDVGVALARRGGPVSRGVGVALVKGMPILLKVLSLVGTAAMSWVGGGIVLHGLEAVHVPLAHHVHHLAEEAGHAVPAAAGLVEWLVSAALSGVFGVLVGALVIPLVQYVLAPAVKAVRGKDKAAMA